MKLETYSDYKKLTFLASHGGPKQVEEILKTPPPPVDHPQHTSLKFWHTNVMMDVIMNPHFTKEHIPLIHPSFNYYDNSKMTDIAAKHLKAQGRM